MVDLVPLVEVEDGAAFRELHDESALITDHERDFVGGESPFTVHSTLFFSKLGVTTKWAFKVLF